MRIARHLEQLGSPDASRLSSQRAAIRIRILKREQHRQSAPLAVCV